MKATMTTAARIYRVEAANGDSVLVKATNQAQALRHVARSIYTVSVPTALEVAEEMQAGQKIEDATKTTESGEQE